MGSRSDESIRSLEGDKNSNKTFCKITLGHFGYKYKALLHEQ